MILEKKGFFVEKMIFYYINVIIVIIFITPW
jgi:hypothetical protein